MPGKRCAVTALVAQLRAGVLEEKLEAWSQGLQQAGVADAGLRAMPRQLISSLKTVAADYEASRLLLDTGVDFLVLNSRKRSAASGMT